MMNGREDVRLTAREARELLRDRAGRRRREEARRKRFRLESRRTNIISWAGFVLTAAIIAAAFYTEEDRDDALFESIAGTCIDCHFEREGWFNPRSWPERWQIGPHTYTTRELMGLRI